MLTLVLFHAFMGMRVVIRTTRPGAGPRRSSLMRLYVLAIVLFVMGTIVVVTLPNVVPAG